MSRRCWTALTATTLLLAGCGDGESDLANDPAVTTTADPSASTTALADVPAPSSASESLELELTSELRVSAGPHTWMIELTNTSESTVDVTFPTSQRGDVVLSRDGERAHRWSDERFFQQQVSEITIGPGDSETIELEDDLSEVEPGFYDASVTVSVVGPPEPAVVSVRVVSP